ncbi:TetR/AcrR family transcriptional regulator [Cellvibrio japonicus]|uniref:Inactive regulatory protein n=1 Tax=Cellvibrio japonicus (strain Ueda107) TaxID=498211 RepID=B3PB68_CELJU|nr:TetR/AcrR family transcriptional regulator [Cellvibrio japonicus]ACE84517.1 inactive regulatory protein [Cellvibrio japonicus Ueda107]QEI11658.1 TetR family transcriptional regulator [Cellvibrio japonicus]QEI15232.1 TetR family transcriptional regulator [Cellvibrio japonicus]QEI18812.1 TetR family transcriptional regulator [Cellvibrio japonicus]
MSKRELKKEHILDEGLKVMATRGYNGTSIQDIVSAADVPKGSFYTYFKSKEDFALEALEKVTEERLRHNRHLLGNRSVPPLERLTRYFQENIGGCENNLNGGCFIGNMCQEMAESSEAIRLKVRQMLRNNTQAIEDLLEEARLDGKLTTNLSSQVIAEFMFNAWEGTLMRMKATKCREPLDVFLAVLPELFND